MSIFPSSKLSIFTSHGLNQTVPAGATWYALPFNLGVINPAAGTFQESVTRSGTFRNLFFAINSAQPGTGSLVITLIVDGAGTPLVITIPAGGGIANYSNLVDQPRANPGSGFRVDILNNAAIASALISRWAVEFWAD